MNLSLSRFFKHVAPATLDTCEQEQIHLSGTIQNMGAMLVVMPGSQNIVGASANIGPLLGAPPEVLLGQPLSSISKDIDEQVSATDDGASIVHEVLDVALEADGTTYDVISHAHGGYRFVEAIPNADPSPALARKRMRLCSKACAQIMNTREIEEAMQIAVDTIRQITGFDRVKIYRFLPDWSGATIAESKVEEMPSYLGLHFPASDIPAQVRELMRIVPYRVVGTVSDDNVPILSGGIDNRELDQTWAMTRSVSAMHTAYLRNMGVNASFSCSLKSEDSLWGLVACHNRTSTCVPVDSWSLVQEIGTALMLRHDQQQRTATADMISSLRKIENSFASQLRQHGEVEEVIAALVPILQTFLRADGFAFQYGANVHTSGRTPPESFIRKIIRWAQDGMDGSDQYQTVDLHAHMPDAREHIDTACGVLIQPIVMHRVCQLIWFRGPITRRVEWAGRPDAKTVTDPLTGVTLGPRKSFDRWVQQHRDQSLPWEPPELESAREIFKEFLDIIAAQVLLKEENASLREFAHVAAHDLKAPLRGISHALDWMVEDAFDPDSVREHQELASVSARKLQKLTEGLIEFSLLGEQRHVFEPVDLNSVIADVNEMLAGEIKMTDTRFVINPLPTITGNAQLLARLFLNLTSNAIKYRDPDRAPVIEFDAVRNGRIEITVTDNGPGIEATYADDIFKPTRRLTHDVDGSGLGLSICQRIARLHGGDVRLDTRHAKGARFVVALGDSV